MNKKLKYVPIVISIIIVLYFLLSLTGIFKTYKSPTTSNEPNLKLNSWFYATNLIEPKIGDFVCYENENPQFGKQTRVHRLCGNEEDTIEIKDGLVYLNGKNLDENTELIHNYKIAQEDFNKINNNEKLTEKNGVHQLDHNTFIIGLETSIAKKYNLNSKRLIDEKGKPDQYISAVFKNNWNKDNFGPIKIPKGKVFVLGDNRDNSEDSRYIGFIKQSDIVGVVISK